MQIFSTLRFFFSIEVSCRWYIWGCCDCKHHERKVFTEEYFRILSYARPYLRL